MNNYYITNKETNKIELHFDKAAYMALDEETKAVKIYDYIVACATCDGIRRVKVDAESFTEAETYAKNIIANLEPWLAAHGKIVPTYTERMQPKMA